MSTTPNLPPFTRSSLRVLIGNFLIYLEKNRGRGRKTITTYQPILIDAIEMIEIDEKKMSIDCMNYRMAISDQEPKTIAKKLSAIRSFIDYLQERGYRFFTQNLNAVRTPKSLPKPATHKQVQETLGVITGEDALLVRLMYGLGLRISEVAGLRVADIHDDWLRVEGKGNKMRQVPIIAPLRDEIRAFIVANAPKTHLFEHNSKPLSDNQLRYKITTSFKRVGLKVTPHQLRHTFATEMLNSGASVVDVSEILGHSQLSTTEIYTKLSSSSKLKNYLTAHPLCKEHIK